MKYILALTAALTGARFSPAAAQANYEIQIYPSETAAKGTTLFELHSNFTGMGERLRIGSAVPTDHAVHETLEITHGFSDIFELGFYAFTSVSAGQGWQFVGSHLRPRIRVPASWKWPVGVSLSTEFGPTDKKYDPSEFGVEFRPIVDQTVGKFYWALNPTIGWSMKGPDAGKGIHGMEFEPSVKLGWQFSKQVQAGVEYYGTTGSVTQSAPSSEQYHMLYPSIDLFLDPDWEFNAGVGFLVSGSGDHNIVKVILGRRFHW